MEPIGIILHLFKVLDDVIVVYVYINKIVCNAVKCTLIFHNVVAANEVVKQTIHWVSHYLSQRYSWQEFGIVPTCQKQLPTIVKYSCERHRGTF